MKLCLVLLVSFPSMNFSFADNCEKSCKGDYQDCIAKVRYNRADIFGAPADVARSVRRSFHSGIEACKAEKDGCLDSCMQNSTSKIFDSPQHEE